MQFTHNTVEPDNARWSPDGKFIIFTAAVYPDCPPFTPQTDASEQAPADKCNSDRDKARADSKVKAQIFTHLLYRHWDHYTGDKRSHLFYVTVEIPRPTRCSGATSRPTIPTTCRPFRSSGGGGFAISPDSKELAFTENPDPEPAISISAQIFTLDLTNPAAKPVKVSTSAGGNFNPAYSPDGKYLAWRSEARAGYESRQVPAVCSTTARQRRPRTFCRSSIAGSTSLLGHLTRNRSCSFQETEAKRPYFTGVNRERGAKYLQYWECDGIKNAIASKFQPLMGSTAILHPMPDNKPRPRGPQEG